MAFIEPMHRNKPNITYLLTVLDGFFPYLAQMITSMRGCVAYDDL